MDMSTKMDMDTITTKNLKALTLKQLSALGEKRYRGVQLYRWIWKRGEDKIENFSDLPKAFRQKLIEEGYYVDSIKEKKRLVSNVDGTIKFLFSDFEAVYMPSEGRRTVCVSSQSGCSLGCKFCATGLLGFKRNLHFWEIADQVLYIQKAVGQKITNVVFMGMGEPLLNLPNVKQAIRIMTSHIGLGIGVRHITVSTSGIVPGIYELADFDRRVKLALSLHAAIQEKREQIMPIARKYKLDELKEALKYYYEKKRRRITLEYIHLAGFNDTDEDVEALYEFTRGLVVKINLIPYNPVPEFDWKSPTEEEVEDFYWRLKKRMLDVPMTVRWSKGRDVMAACGQLALIEKIDPTFIKMPAQEK